MLVEETQSLAYSKEGFDTAVPEITWAQRSLHKLSPEEQVVMVSCVSAEKVSTEARENVVF